MHTCLSCGAEIDDMLVFCDDRCESDYMNHGELEVDEDDDRHEDDEDDE